MFFFIHRTVPSIRLQLRIRLSRPWLVHRKRLRPYAEPRSGRRDQRRIPHSAARRSCPVGQVHRRRPGIPCGRQLQRRRFGGGSQSSSISSRCWCCIYRWWWWRHCITHQIEQCSRRRRRRRHRLFRHGAITSGGRVTDMQEYGGRSWVEQAL